jgi:hypothetical protein
MVEQVANQNRIAKKKEVLFPQRCPGKQNQEDAQFEAEKDEQDEHHAEHTALRREGG